MLDRLCLGGEVVWGRVSRQHGGGPLAGQSGRAPFSRSTPITLALRESLDWLLTAEGADTEGLTGAPKETLDYLSRRGASFLSDIVNATNRMPSDVEEALWTLAASGLATADGLESMRQRLRGTKRPRHNGKSGRARPGRGNLHRRRGYSRWSLLEPVEPVDDRTEAVARQLLLRYGILFPELLARDALAVRWRDLVRVLRRLEARGEVRGGRFVSGFVGEQFALPEAMDSLRKLNNRADGQAMSPQVMSPAERARYGARPDKGEMVVVSACDPLNLAGILTPGDRVPAVLGNRLVYRDGVPLAAIEGGAFVTLGNTLGNVAPAILERARTLLEAPMAYAAYQVSHQQEEATA